MGLVWPSVLQKRGVTDSMGSSSMFFVRTEYCYDIGRLKQEWESIDHPESRYGQISVQCSEYDLDNPYTDSCGKFTANGKDAIQDRYPDIKTESQFNLINDLYENTLFDQILSEHEGYRARLMNINPKTAYSVHTDPRPRYHLALDTNPNAFFVFPIHQEIVHIPEDGYVYWINTTMAHTFVNCGDKPRTHFVFSGGE